MRSQQGEPRPRVFGVTQLHHFNRIHRRTRTSLSIRKVHKFAENEVVDSIYFYRQQVVQKLQWHGFEQYQKYLNCMTQYICKLMAKELQENYSDELSESPANCSCQFYVQNMAPCPHVLTRAIAEGTTPVNFHPGNRWRLSRAEILMKGTAGMESDGPASAVEHAESEEDSVVPRTRLCRHDYETSVVSPMVPCVIHIMLTSPDCSRLHPNKKRTSRLALHPL